MWRVDQTEEENAWFKNLDEEAREAILEAVKVLAQIGPALGRPRVDSIDGSKHQNMKELRVQNKGRLFRIFFAFDPERVAMLLIGGDKKGNKRFYDQMIPKADKLYDRHLENFRKG